MTNGGIKEYNTIVNEDVKCIVLKVSRPFGEPNFSTEIFGRTLEQWVTLSMRGLEVESVVYDGNENFLPSVKPHINPARTVTVVLYSDTPLISYASVSEAVAKLKSEKMFVLKMPRGWVFNTAFLLDAEKIHTDKTYYFGDDDYVTVYNNNQLAYTSDILRARIAHYFMEHGVRLEDPNSTLIGADVVIEPGAVIGPFNQIKGKTLIKSGAVICSNCVIESSIIGKGAVIKNSTLTDAIVGENCSIGPYAHLRPKAVLAENVHVGDYVEIKNSRIGAGSKLGHLAYVGDADIGRNCNISAGVIFANYDGLAKRKIILGNDVFVGSNSTLVAPLNIGDGAFIAAASAVTEDINGGALAIARARQVNKEDWKKNPYTNKK